MNTTIIAWPADDTLYFYGQGGPARLTGLWLNIDGHKLAVAPITPTGISGNCSIDIPLASVDDLIKALTGLRRACSAVPSLTPQEAAERRAQGRLVATFRPQTWANDNAVDTEDNVEFDATVPLLALGLQGIRDFRVNDDHSDRLADDLQERMEHDGPFEVDVDLDGWLEQHGVPDRVFMDGADYDRLCEKFKVKPPTPTAQG